MLIKENRYTYKYIGVIKMMREFEIERQFQIKIDIIKANKGVYYLKTNKGERCLKKINYGPQKLLFVYGAKSI